jgi:hypothetical protein
MLVSFKPGPYRRADALDSGRGAADGDRVSIVNESQPLINP